MLTFEVMFLAHSSVSELSPEGKALSTTCSHGPSSLQQGWDEAGGKNSFTTQGYALVAVIAYCRQFQK